MTGALTGGAGQDWQATLRERVEQAVQRRVLAADRRREAARRRAHGLIDRHAARLARVHARAEPQPAPGRGARSSGSAPPRR